VDREQVISTEVMEVVATDQVDSGLGATDRAHKLEMDMVGIIIINA
jgi:molybdate-binding protein